MRKRKFWSDVEGGFAIEFAFIAIPFFSLLIGVVQLAMIFIAGNLLDTGMKEATRAIYTGQAQQDSWASGGNKLDKFREQVCHKARFVMDCDKIEFDIRVLSSFNDAQPEVHFKSDGTVDQSKLSFSMGSAGSVMSARAIYLFPVYADLLGSGLINAGTDKRLIVSTNVFVNEPFN